MHKSMKVIHTNTRIKWIIEFKIIGVRKLSRSKWFKRVLGISVLATIAYVVINNREDREIPEKSIKVIRCEESEKIEV